MVDSLVPSARHLYGLAGILIFIKDPNDGGKILSEESRTTLFKWCDEHCTGRYWIGMGFGKFENTEDALAFQMRWQ